MKLHHTKTLLLSAAVTAGMCGLSAASLAAGEPNSDITQVDREIGIPTPGSVQDQETTDKKRNPAKAHRPDLDAQVTLGGAQYFVEGTIAQIEDDHYFVNRHGTGEQVRLFVDRDTNLDCAAMPDRGSTSEGGKEAITNERISPQEQAPDVSSVQMDQGQRADETARGAGFRIGECAFRIGDMVKAEVDDNGKVTTMKFLAGDMASSPRSVGPSAGTGSLAIPGEQDQPAQLDMTGAEGIPPKEYSVTPVRQGKLETAESHPFIGKPVVNLQDEHVGTIDTLLVDLETGKIEYAVILVAHTEHHLHPIPWSALQVKNGQNGEAAAILDTNQYNVHPSVMMKDAVDFSPDAEQIVKKMELLRSREQKVASERPIDRQEVGIHGESETGGAGPSGTPGPPAGPAPQFEQEKDRP